MGASALSTHRRLSMNAKSTGKPSGSDSSTADNSPLPDRRSAGIELGARVAELGLPDPLVVGLPRGGVPVAAEVARILGAPLDIVVVRKIGAPMSPELAIGAVGEDDAIVVHEHVARKLGVSEAELESAEEKARRELEVLRSRLRGERAPLAVAGRDVVLVDDGVATGSTAEAAAMLLRQRGAKRIVLAVPVGAPESLDALSRAVDDVVALRKPFNLIAVGYHYRDFSPVSSETVAELLADSGTVPASPGFADDGHPVDGAGALDGQLRLSGDGVELDGDLVVPPDAGALILFAHGSGSSRLSPRNQEVASALNRAGLATLLFDLLTEQESADRAKVFDVDLLAERLAAATRSVRAQPGVGRLPTGYFGASTGAAAALIAAAENPDSVGAVVSRGGRPDLAAHVLGEVRAPTLLIVGGDDTAVVALNRDAASRMTCEHEIEIVPGATHLFVEPGALQAVAESARDWFTDHLG